MKILSLALAWLSGKKTYLLAGSYILQKLYELTSGDLTGAQFIDQAYIAATAMTVRAGISKAEMK